MRLGIDLGGTKIEIVALAEDGRELLRQRLPTPQGDYRATVQALAHLVQEVERMLQQRGSVGVGIPGTISALTGCVKNANSICLIGRPLREDLQQLLQREVRLANDANCFALSEAQDGAGMGATTVFGVILGTGVGGGIVIHGQLLTGANAIAGEWGHNALAAEESYQVRCYCGRTGCIETYLSGPGMLAEHRAHWVQAGRTREAEVAALSVADVPTLVARAEAGDPLCLASLQRYEQRLARALAQVINVLDPEVIVLGGGLSNIDRLYSHVPCLWGEWVFSDQVVTRLLRNQHGDSSGVRGAAGLWPVSG